jgi:hypothetical protein
MPNRFIKRARREQHEQQQKTELKKLSEKFETGKATPQEIARLTVLADEEIMRKRS